VDPRFADRWKSSISETTEARWFRVFRDRRIGLVAIRFLVLEESAPYFGVVPWQLLGGGRPEDAFVSAFETACVGVPHVLTLEAILVVIKQIADLRTPRSFAPLSTT